MKNNKVVYYFGEIEGPPKYVVNQVHLTAFSHLSSLKQHGASVEVGYAHKHHDGSLPLLETYALFADMHRKLGYVPANIGHAVVARVKIPVHHARHVDALLSTLEQKCGLVRLDTAQVSAK